MSQVTFGEVQRAARAAGFVMSRREGLIHLRYRDDVSTQTWRCSRAHDALQIIQAAPRIGITENSPDVVPELRHCRDQGDAEVSAGQAFTTKTTAMKANTRA